MVDIISNAGGFLRQVKSYQLNLLTQSYGLKEICSQKNLANYFQPEDNAFRSRRFVGQFTRFLGGFEPPEPKIILKSKILGYSQNDLTATRSLKNGSRLNSYSATEILKGDNC